MIKEIIAWILAVLGVFMIVDVIESYIINFLKLGFLFNLGFTSQIIIGTVFIIISFWLGFSMYKLKKVRSM